MARVPAGVIWTILCILVQIGDGEAQSDTKMLVQSYENYGFAEKMRLSAAYFVNPELANQADVARFVPLKGLNEDEQARATQLIADGDAHLSTIMPNGKFYKIIEPNIDLDVAKLNENMGIIVGRKEMWTTGGVPVVSWGDLKTAGLDEVYDEIGKQEGTKSDKSEEGTARSTDDDAD